MTLSATGESDQFAVPTGIGYYTDSHVCVLWGNFWGVAVVEFRVNLAKAVNQWAVPRSGFGGSTP